MCFPVCVLRFYFKIQFHFNIWKSFSEIRIKRHFPHFYHLMAPALRNCRRRRGVSESLFRFMLCKESKRNLPTECKLIGESHESSMPKTRAGDGRVGCHALSDKMRVQIIQVQQSAMLMSVSENSRVATTLVLRLWPSSKWLFIKQEHIGFETTYNIRIIDFHST